jgi:hypothetical protein
VDASAPERADRPGRRNALAWLVRLLHIVLVIFVCVGPFVNDLHLLLLYLMVVPFIYLHWVTNNDTCALTLMECKLRGIEPGKSFIHSLVSPVYKFNEQHESTFVWLATFALWLVAVYRYYFVMRRAP